jgi:hypothetical protein
VTPRGLWPSLEATRRIVANSIPCPNRERLREQLYAFRCHLVEREAEAGGWRTGRDKRAKAIAGAADTLLRALEKPQDRMLDIRLIWTVDVSRAEIIEVLGDLKRAAESVPPKPDRKPAGLKAWVVRELAAVFEACFERSGKYTRDCEGVNGALVSFIQAVAAEIKLEISGETIAKALAEPRTKPPPITQE